MDEKCIRRVVSVSFENVMMWMQPKAPFTFVVTRPLLSYDAQRNVNVFERYSGSGRRVTASDAMWVGTKVKLL